jgi:UDP-galactopyranose mutase
MQPISNFFINIQARDPVDIAVLFEMVARTEISLDANCGALVSARKALNLQISEDALKDSLQRLVNCGDLETTYDADEGKLKYRVVVFQRLQEDIARHGRKLYNRMAQQKRREKG